MLVCLNGQLMPQEDAQVAVNDGAFLYGDSLFETIKARHQQILLLDQHLDRIAQAAELLDFPCPRAAIETAFDKVAATLTSPASRIRLTLSRGPGNGLLYPDPNQGWFLISAVPYTELDDHCRAQGINCCLAPNQRVNPFSPLPQIKHGNYADCLYARNYAYSKQADEALFIDANCNLLEGATSNLFVMIDNTLVTPSLGSLVLNGVMRRLILDASKELQITCSECPLPLTDALSADEVFICNSLIDILPVRSIDGQQIKTGECWKEIYKRISARIGS